MMATLRQRNRRAAMRATQRSALELFQAKGFDSVTVEEIAASVGMAASTIYRHFGTKEAIVLWNEHEPAIEEALIRHLGSKEPLEAIREALVESLAANWDDDPFQLERVCYIYATEELHVGAVEADYRDRAELTAALRLALPTHARDAAPVLAGAALVALDVAVDRWQQAKGRHNLAEEIQAAFDTLAQLGSIG